MNDYFLVKIKYEKEAENGKVVKVQQQFLVNALSFSEAEAKIISEMELYLDSGFEVLSIAKYKLADILLGDAFKYFRAKVSFIDIDKEADVIKRTNVFVLVSADNVKDAEASLRDGMKDSMRDYEVPSIVETKIIEIIK